MGETYAAEPEPYPQQQPARERYRPEPQQADPYAEAPRIDYDSGPGASYERPGMTMPASSRYPAAQPSAPQTVYQDDPAANAAGPRGSSQRGAGEERYDEVGYAGVRGVAGGDANGGAVVAVARAMPAGSFAEVTNLETGRTILVLVTGPMGPGADHPVDLSPAAARQLGAGSGSIPVRVRKVNASAQDQAALTSGQPAGERADTPPVLLAALRKHLPTGGGDTANYTPQPSYTSSAAVRSAPVRQAPARAAPTQGGYFVQVGAFSNAANAQALARSLGGFVRAGGGLNRVQMGPYRSAGEAEAARAKAASQGYGDARVFAQN